MKHIILIWTIVLLPSSLAYSQSRTDVRLPAINPFDELVPTDFCEVTGGAHIYDGKVIRLRAIFNLSRHGSVLSPYGPNTCWESMRVRFDCSGEADCNELSNTLRRSIPTRGLEGRSALIVFGRFKHQRLLTYRQIQLGFHRYEFYVSRVVEVLKLPQPSDAKSQP